MSIQRIWTFATVFALCSLAPVAADTGISQQAPLTGSQWDILRERVNLLDKIAFLPSLLPVIMKNRDALELSDAQVVAFQEWRRLHYQNMVGLMNEIIQRRITLSKATLDVHISGDDILAQQKEIFRLQERLLHVRLSCRNLIVETFSDAQWGNLAFVLEEYPRYAGLLDD